jgi:four helix bundle protein
VKGLIRSSLVRVSEDHAVLIRNAKDLIVYQKAFRLAMRVFDVSKSFPRDEAYSLTSQVRRSSRSVCLNLREAWAKRRYRAHFLSKLTDSDGENNETETALDFALECGYLTREVHQELIALCGEIGRMLGSMIRNPDTFLVSGES